MLELELLTEFWDAVVRVATGRGDTCNVQF
jgi:hypothetical protein